MNQLKVNEHATTNPCVIVGNKHQIEVFQVEQAYAGGDSKIEFQRVIMVEMENLPVHFI